jgi:hypothetical protein
MTGGQRTARSAWWHGAPIANAVWRARCAPVYEIVVCSHGVSPLHFDGTISAALRRAANTSIDVRLRDSDLVY